MNDLRRTGFRGLVYTLMLSTTLTCGLQIAAQAMLAPAYFPEPAAGDRQRRAEDTRAVQAALESKVLRQRLKELGLSEREIQSRLDKLSDRDLHELALRARALNAGGDDGGAIAGLLVLVLLVLLIVYLVKRI
ncbi:MAG TPA: PA2779 family protein [Elusimicrobiota bacterium]|jgi:hypothetical protein|nr:PA2779 family protein [Elusimicrobiota bacterium]